MTIASYEAKLYAFSRYATLFVTTEEERVPLFVKEFNLELYVLSVHMTSSSKIFNKVTDFVKKVERVRLHQAIGHLLT